MLLAPIHYRTHTLCDAEILHLEVRADAAVALFSHRCSILLVAIPFMTIRLVVRRHICAASSCRFSVDGTLPAEDECIFPVMLVVDRNVPINGVGALDPILLAKESGKIRQDKFGHIELVIVGIIKPPDFVASDAVLGQLGLVALHPRSDSPVVQVLTRGTFNMSMPRVVMQKREVSEIEIPFIALEVVAIAKELDCKGLIFRDAQKFVVRKERRLTGSHVSKDSPGPLHARIGELANRIALR